MARVNDTQQFAHSDLSSKFLYVMGGRGLLEGSVEHICRIALCEGVLMQRTLDTCTVEAASGEFKQYNVVLTIFQLEALCSEARHLCPRPWK